MQITRRLLAALVAVPLVGALTTGPAAAASTGWNPPQRFELGYSVNGRVGAANLDGNIFTVWRNSVDDGMTTNGLYGSPKTFPGRTSGNPAATVIHGRIYVGWKGVDGDNRMFMTSSGNGVDWSPEAVTPGETTDGPALTVFNGQIYQAWRGATGNTINVASTFDGVHWSPTATVPGGASDSPALAVFNGRLRLAWKGVPGDNRLFYSSSADGVNWTTFSPPIAGTTSGSPTLAAFDNGLYLAWKGATDNHLYFTISPDGEYWPSGGDAGVGGSAYGPTFVQRPDGTYLYLLWHTDDGSDQIRYSWRHTV
ncbi:sialidase family protein [Kutzneria sp. 744]|uniref:sialidase family protein n=1 Tax=Kutzneria sp. (strain 744) TaxID=345341 RepID=UPI0003EEE046|nr:sialidase family protein [Kutzneria sp. 744]EWM14737.1 cell surface protein [Kutzneria sp. 744]